MIGRVTIYSPEGVALIETTIRDESRYTRKLMGEHSVRVRFDWAEAKALPYGAYIEYAERRWRLYAPYIPSQREGVASYDVAFHAPEAELKNFTAFYMSQGMMEADWSLTGTIEQYCRELRNNLGRIQGGEAWGLEHHGIDERTSKHLTFEGVTIWGALDKIAEAFGCEWWCEADKSLHLGKLTSAEERTARLGELATSFTPQGEGNPLIGRLYAFGSTRNIGQGYRRTDGVTSRITEPRLHLPTATPYIEGVKHGIEAVQTFEDVYPKYIGRVSGVATRDSAGDTIYTIEDGTMLVPEASLLSGQALKLKFESGALGGFEFEARITSGGYELIPNDDYGTRLPSGKLAPKVGDEYAPFGFDISLVGTDYVPRAEAELERVATEWLERNNQDRRDVQLTTNPIYTYRQGVRLELGERIRLVGAIPSGDKVGRITAIEHSLANPYSITALVGETKPEGVLSKLEHTAHEAGDKAKAYAKAQTQQAKAYVDRGLRDAQEAQTAIARAMGDKYDPTINPLAVETMQTLVGNVATQFTFRRGLYDERTATPNIHVKGDKRLHIEERTYIKHHTLGIEEVRGRHATTAYQWWALEAFVSLPMDYPERLYYLYAVAHKGQAVAHWHVSAEPIALEQVADKYHLLTAIIGAENSRGDRSITPLYGFTEVLPGQINTSRIVSNDGGTYFDLQRGEIGGNIRFRGGKSADALIAEALKAREASDYLRQALRNGTTEIGGGLVASHLIALKDQENAVRAYIDGRGGASVAFGAGVSNFGASNEVRNVSIHHDGSCAIGEMRVERGSGRISFEDENGTYLSLGGSVDSLSDLANTRMYRLEERSASFAHIYANQYHRGTHTDAYHPQSSTSVFISVHGFVLSARVDVARYRYGQHGGGTTIRLIAVTDSGRITIAETSIGKDKGTYSINESDSTPLSLSGQASIPRGNMWLELEVERSEYAELTLKGVSVTYSGDNESIAKGRLALGGNGLALYLRSHEALSIIKGHGLRYVGACDMPGWLASGVVDANHVTLRLLDTPYYKVVGWGAKVNAQGGTAPLCAGVEEGTYGYYRVHHSVGHTNYSVSITVHADKDYLSGDVSATIWHKQANTFWVYIRHNGGMLDKPAIFDYTIHGLNYTP